MFLWIQKGTFKAYSLFAGILLFGYIRGYSSFIHIPNLYAPYSDRRPFWDRIDACDILDMDFMIVEGDFKTTFRGSEGWGRRF